jgi:hypothetical protein
VSTIETSIIKDLNPLLGLGKHPEFGFSAGWTVPLKYQEGPGWVRNVDIRGQVENTWNWRRLGDCRIVNSEAGTLGWVKDNVSISDRPFSYSSASYTDYQCVWTYTVRYYVMNSRVKLYRPSVRNSVLGRSPPRKVHHGKSKCMRTNHQGRNYIQKSVRGIPPIIL